ncbi:peptidoglycan-binding protein [uncultured Psychromonas sp.]|uniref:peptidoglycan-binding domain-containing protein n=1 Tax=uncultured Psychromonas sp. TaxID=173974 RepID=UPI00261B8E14|nr:peptidoglycan-binding protein [uncultured Psychromonas sp.]
MKYSTLIILGGLMLSHQAFSQNNGQNTSKCYTQNSKNSKGCQVTNGVTQQQKASKAKIQGQQKVVVKTPQKVIVKTPQKTVKNQQKVIVKTPQKVVVKKPQKTVKTVKTQQKVVVIKSAPIGSNLVLQTQQQLNRLGFNAGPADGLMGKKTRQAIKLFQKRNNIHVDGKSTSILLIKLKNK